MSPLNMCCVQKQRGRLLRAQDSLADSKSVGGEGPFVPTVYSVLLNSQLCLEDCRDINDFVTRKLTQAVGLGMIWRRPVYSEGWLEVLVSTWSLQASHPGQSLL